MLPIGHWSEAAEHMEEWCDALRFLERMLPACCVRKLHLCQWILYFLLYSHWSKIYLDTSAAASLRWPIFDENPSAYEEGNDVWEEQQQQGYRIATKSEYSICGFQIWAKVHSMFHCSSSDSFRPCNRVKPTSLSQTSQATEKWWEMWSGQSWQISVRPPTPKPNFCSSIMFIIINILIIYIIYWIITVQEVQ